MNQSGCYDVNGINDAQEFNETKHAMKVIGMTDDEQSEVFRLVASVLHVGNIEFKAGGKGAEIDNQKIVEIAASLLKVTPQNLSKVNFSNNLKI